MVTTTSTNEGLSESEPRSTPGQIARGVIRTNEFAMLMILIVGCILVTLKNPHFLAVSNIGTLGRDIAMIGIVAVGETFVILLGGIDLSVGSIYGLSGVLVAFFCVVPYPEQQIATLGLPTPIAIIITIAICVVIGIVHGLFVSKFKMHGFLITLVTLGLARGLAIAITTGYPITGIPPDVTDFAQGSLLNIPIPFIVFMVVALIAVVLTRFTYIGRQIYAVGGNTEAARLSGVRVDRRIILCYAISTGCAAIVGIIGAGRLTEGHPSAGDGTELIAIAACVLGGISLMGGQGSIMGAFIGAMVIGVLSNAMIILKVSPYWQQVVLGIILLIAITFDMWRRRRREAKL